MEDNDILDMSEMKTVNSAAHSSAKTFMIIMAVLWGLLFFVDMFFIMVFEFIFGMVNAFGGNDYVPLTVQMLRWDLFLYPVLMIVALVGGFSALGKGNYNAVYTYGLLPLASVIIFFILVAIMPHQTEPQAF